MPDDFGRRSPDFDPEGDYMTSDEKSDRQADNVLEEWKTEREEDNENNE